MQVVPLALLAAMAGSALSAPCAVETLNHIESQLLAFPTLKACDGPTPGWSFYAFYTEDSAFPTSAQTSIFESYPACQTVYKAFQDVLSGTPACDFYPNEPLHKLASFPHFRDLVSYIQSHEARTGETATLTPTSNNNNNNNNASSSNNNNGHNNNSSSNGSPAPTLARCNVADVGSVVAQIKAIPQAAQCANVTKFDFDAFFAQTNVFPSPSQVALFESTPACDVLLADVKIILRQGPHCNFYENVSLQKMAAMPSFQDLVSLEMVHDHPGAQVATTATPLATSSDGTSTKSTSEGATASSGVSVVGAVAIAAAAILVVAGAVWAIRRKRQQDKTGDDTQQSIYVVNAHSAL
ncbi:hypothetical protein SPRG_14983 [Saprolegnia parasitica CBS 223.65]|uniref:Uncharacterized protein n=1 Tax=Saprolegnia parasitica (strain CBS 223.65) TaxID=695850 RepID=A0A067BMU3_SAPPC|nr:hypothetical protein SPRG_14983 [Saprolegnia parasitica CBS 223.65]KDO19789.1 hypothetical protein SPRG_14983 [Saprolegnia parasitica CBS 223.65]|eukprot:XP_012209497.1 hypothetical protein SPRG_14983 [Saprolegnia parasitica CBS 223.65]